MPRSRDYNEKLTRVVSVIESITCDIQVARSKKSRWTIEDAMAALDDATRERMRFALLKELRGDVVVQSSSKEPARVPSLAEVALSYVCSAERMEAILGDLERNFRRHAAKYGERAARRWYWWQTIRAIAALTLQFVIKVALIDALLRKLNL